MFIRTLSSLSIFHRFGVAMPLGPRLQALQYLQMEVRQNLMVYQ